MEPTRSMIALTLLVSTAAAYAGNSMDQLQSAVQPEFRLSSVDSGAPPSYKLLSPAEPLGITGFNISILPNSSEIENAIVPEEVTSSDASSNIITKLQPLKGLPLGLETGTLDSLVRGYNIKLVEFDPNYEIFPGDVAALAEATHGSHTELSGIDQPGFDTKGIDMSGSNSSAILMPYFGLESVWVTSTQFGVPLIDEKLFRPTENSGGVSLHFGQLNLEFEADQTGDVISYGATWGLQF